MAEQEHKVSGYHAHVYYDPDTKELAGRVREGLGAFDVKLGGWHDVPVGPHPKAMYQVAFTAEHFDKVVPWLMLHRENLDVLVHPSTGEHVGDHRDRSLWMGTKLVLRLDSFG
jgi:DOPA 4,5-dioxygenase